MNTENLEYQMMLNQQNSMVNLQNGMQILNDYSLLRTKYQQTHVRAFFNMLSTHDKAQYVQSMRQSLTVKEIAAELDIGESTVYGYLNK